MRSEFITGYFYNNKFYPSMLSTILKNSKPKLNPPIKSTIPKLIETHKNVQSCDTNLYSIQKCYDFINAPYFTDCFDFSKFIKYLEGLLSDKCHFEKLQDNLCKLKIKYAHLLKVRSEEEEMDRMEIQLSKMQEEYSFINNLHNIDINSLTRQREALEKRRMTISSEFSEKIRKFLSQVETLDLDNFIKLSQSSIECFEVLSYFSFVQNNEQYREIVKNYDAKEKIQKLCDSIKKRLCVALIKFKTISVEKFAMSMNIDRNEVLIVVIDLAFYGIASFDNIDTVQLKEDI